MVETIKFSEFTSGGDLANDDTTVGLSSGGENVRFNNPWTFLPSGTTLERPAPSATINYRLRFNTDLQSYEFYDAVAADWTQLEDSGDVNALIARLAAHTNGDGASMIGLENQTGVTDKTVQDLANAGLIAKTSNGTLTNGQFLADLTTGILKSTTGTGTLSISASLTSIDGLTTSANQIIYTTAANTWATSAITSFGRSLIDDASAGDARTTLGLGTIATQNANAVAITGGTIDGTVIGGSTPADGSFTQATVDNLNLNGNTLSSISGGISILPFNGATTVGNSGASAQDIYGRGAGTNTTISATSNNGFSVRAYNDSATNNNFSLFDSFNSNGLIDGRMAFIHTDHAARTASWALALHNGSSLTTQITVNPSGVLGVRSGIGFPATQVPSADANTLDDYEEGTFTPVVADATTGGNVASGTFTGRYTKVGRVVTFSMQMNSIDTTGMTAGNTVYFRGLPFTSASTAPFTTCTMLTYLVDYATVPIQINGNLPINTTYIVGSLTRDNATLGTLIVSEINSGTAIIGISGSYQI